jgi:macrophage erythroblast attacher
MLTVLSLQNLVDIRVFIESRRIEEALARHDCTDALAWCRENGSRLKKIESTLEFRLRLQEFIELARAGRRMDAIAHAKKYLAASAGTHMGEIQRAMALLAFPADTACGPYRALYDKSRWSDLRAQFRRDNYVLHSLSTLSLISITLQAGLSAFKTRLCYQPENKNANCPVCAPLMNSLAERLPFSHRIHSALVCRMSGDVINDHNLPLMLPNGYVYGQRALAEMADKNNGLVTCPRSNTTHRLADCKKVFIM